MQAEATERETLRLRGSVVVARAAEDLYDMVADVVRMGDWSPVCRACWWDEGSGPRVGDWFTGRNERDGRTWQTRSQVQVADRGREFAFVVGGSAVRWGYRFLASDEGTVIEESWQLLPDGVAAFEDRYGAGVAAVIADRRETARHGIDATLARIKAAAESGSHARGEGKPTIMTDTPAAELDDIASSEGARERGLALMTRMLGADKVARIAHRNTIAPDWQRLTTEVLFGDVWLGDGLTLAQRSMVTVAALVALNRGRELANHLEAAIENGVTVEELVQIAQHVGFYAGWPTVGEALNSIQQIVERRNGS